MLIKSLRLSTCILLFILTSCSAVHQYNNEYATQATMQALQPHYCPIQGGQLEYYRLGHGSPMVLIAGYATDVSSWNRQFLFNLAKRHQVIVFNNRQVGKSYVNSNQYSSHDLAKDTYQLIEGLQLKKPVLLGISMGGMIAQQVAVTYPNKISRLILINTAMPGKKAVRPSKQIEEVMLNLPNNKLGFYLIAINYFFPPNWRRRMSIALASDRFQPNHYSEIDITAVAPMQKKLLLQWANDEKTANKLANLRLPVLILNGLADQVIPPVNSLILFHTIPHAQLKYWQEGGHAMIYQYPYELAKAIK